MNRVLCVILALVSFVVLAGFPWVYWEAARLVMRDEAPPYLAWLVSKRLADGIWWLMGITLIFWAPIAVAIAGAVASGFLALGFARKPEGFDPKRPWRRLG